MRIEYQNKFHDVVLFNISHQFRMPILQVAFLMLAIAISWNPSKPAYTAINSAIFYTVLWIAQLVFACVVLYSRKNHTVLTDHVIELQENALMEETRFNRSFFFWSGGLHKVVMRANRVAVYVTPFMAHIIPPQAFSSKAQRTEFIEAVRTRMKAAQ